MIMNAELNVTEDWEVGLLGTHQRVWLVTVGD